MNKKVTVVDYGSGNLQSVTCAFEFCGADVRQATKPVEILEADYLVLPGVGAFEAAMQQLRDHHFVEPILKYMEKQRPFLGICVGMQMMLDDSTEFGSYKGLGMIRGGVRPIPKTDTQGNLHPIPHIGWNKLLACYDDWRGTILDGIDHDLDAVYFVHSYAALPESDEHILADCEYNGRKLTAAICSENLYGCQFHPENSGKVGLKILQNYIDLT